MEEEEEEEQHKNWEEDENHRFDGWITAACSGDGWLEPGGWFRAVILFHRVSLDSEIRFEVEMFEDL